MSEPEVRVLVIDDEAPIRRFLRMATKCSRPARAETDSAESWRIGRI